LAEFETVLRATVLWVALRHLWLWHDVDRKLLIDHILQFVVDEFVEAAQPNSKRTAAADRTVRRAATAVDGGEQQRQRRSSTVTTTHRQ
jgi:hypothetical protein